jgi:GNAT superfamily N-acetyltransferase
VQDPFYQAITPPVGRRAMLTTYFALALSEARRAGEVQTLAEAAGAAIWTAPAGAPLADAAADDKHRALRRLLDPDGWSAYEAIGRFFRRQVAAVVPPGAWYLSILGVAPDRRGAGLGAGLLRPTLDRLDAERRPSYLETFNPLSLPFYARQGYVVAATAPEPITNATYWILTRSPR